MRSLKKMLIHLLAVFVITIIMSMTGLAITWEVIDFDIAGGGTITDIHVLDRATENDQIWVASMNGGAFWAEYVNGNWEESWNTVQPDRSCLAVDAIENSSGDVYGLIGAGGVFISTDASAANPDWDRPGGNANYPNEWRSCTIHGVAFYESTTGGYDEDQFYVVRKFDEDAGVYRWIENSNDFTNISTVGDDGFCSIYRDLSDGNTLYFPKSDPDGSYPYVGGLYELSGSYTNSLTAINITGGTNDIESINSFSQDPEDPSIAYIVLRRYSQGQLNYELWSGNLSTEQFTKKLDLDDPDLDDYIMSIRPEIRAVGRWDDSEQYNRVWLFSNTKGCEYIEVENDGTILTEQQLIYDNYSISGCPDLMSWSHRDVLYDPLHYSTSDNILLGTWMAGVWNLDFSSTSTYSWDDLSEGNTTQDIGFYGTESRQVVMCEYNNNPHLLISTFINGLWAYNVSNGSWVKLGQEVANVNNTLFGKTMNCAVESPFSSESNTYYFGTRGKWAPYVHNAWEKPTGLFKVDASGATHTISQTVEFPDLGPNDDDAKYYTFMTLTPYSDETNSYLYAATGDGICQAKLDNIF